MIRSPVCFLLSPVLILMINHVTTSTNCPDPSRAEWKTKNAEECTPGTKYHCQYDGGTNLITDMCAEPVTCTEGTHALLDDSKKTVSCVSCSRDMYQPTQKSSYEFTQPNCDYRKTPCKPDLGELECGAATSSQNYQCKCDYTKGFKPSFIESKCDCFVKDSSSCECSKCKEGEVLAANYSCIAVGSTTTTSTTVSTTQMSSDTPGESISGGAVAGITTGIVVILTIVIGIVIISVWKYKRQPGAKRKKSQDENVNKQAEEPLMHDNKVVNDHENTTQHVSPGSLEVKDKPAEEPLMQDNKVVNDHEDTTQQHVSPASLEVKATGAKNANVGTSKAVGVQQLRDEVRVEAGVIQHNTTIYNIFPDSKENKQVKEKGEEEASATENKQ